VATLSAEEHRAHATIKRDGGKFPIPDKAHARAALARLNQSDLSPAEKEKVKRAARAKLAEGGIEEADFTYFDDGRLDWLQDVSALQEAESHFDPKQPRGRTGQWIKKLQAASTPAARRELVSQHIHEGGDPGNNAEAAMVFHEIADAEGDDFVKATLKSIGHRIETEEHAKPLFDKAKTAVAKGEMLPGKSHFDAATAEQARIDKRWGKDPSQPHGFRVAPDPNPTKLPEPAYPTGSHKLHAWDEASIRSGAMVYNKDYTGSPDFQKIVTEGKAVLQVTTSYADKHGHKFQYNVVPAIVHEAGTIHAADPQVIVWPRRDGREKPEQGAKRAAKKAFPNAKAPLRIQRRHLGGIEVIQEEAAVTTEVDWDERAREVLAEAGLWDKLKHPRKRGGLFADTPDAPKVPERFAHTRHDPGSHEYHESNGYADGLKAIEDHVRTAMRTGAFPKVKPRAPVDAHPSYKEGWARAARAAEAVAKKHMEGASFKDAKGKTFKVKENAVLEAETSSSSLPDLPNKPGKTNWVEKAGGLPRYIERIAKHLHSEKGMDVSRAIATAVNVVKRMCASGDTNFPGKQSVNAKSRAQACAAVADWERKKVSHAATDDRQVAGALRLLEAHAVSPVFSGAIEEIAAEIMADDEAVAEGLQEAARRDYVRNRRGQFATLFKAARESHTVPREPRPDPRSLAKK
jgi:hypothetical protein